MNAKKNKLIVRQLDKRLQSLLPLLNTKTPKEGWINLLRKTFNTSLRQLGNRLSLTPQGMRKIEKKEADESISIKTLRKAGDALSMKLVYGFIPKDGSLEKIIEISAADLARRIVMRTSTTMKLKDQQISNERIEEAIAEMTEELERGNA